MAACACEPLDQLPDGQLLAIDDVDHELETAGYAARTVGLDQMAREGPVEIKARKIEAEHLAQLHERVVRLDQVVELLLKSVGLGLCRADERADAGQDLDLVWIAIESACLALDVGVERLRAGERLVRREDGFGEAGCKGATVVERAGLHIDRAALR